MEKKSATFGFYVGLGATVRSGERKEFKKFQGVYLTPVFGRLKLRRIVIHVDSSTLTARERTERAREKRDVETELKCAVRLQKGQGWEAGSSCLSAPYKSLSLLLGGVQICDEKIRLLVVFVLLFVFFFI